MKQRRFLPNEEFAELIVDSDSDYELSGGVSDSSESGNDLSVKQQRTVKTFSSDRQDGEDREVTAPFTCPKCDVAPQLEPFAANPEVKTTVTYPLDPMQTAALFMHER